MKLSEFDYSLPKELIAQYPLKDREECRLMVLDRQSQEISHRIFKDISGYLREGDCLVLNDTKVIPARLFGKRRTGGKVELFLLEKKNPVCEVLVKPSARLREGERIRLESDDEVEILGRAGIGRLVRFLRPLDEVLQDAGHVPLPPYIDRMDEESDRYDYQTAYAREEGATASPTAGLHFTKGLLDAITKMGVRIEYVTLHTNYGTFAPIKTEEIETHKMHKEEFILPDRTRRAIYDAKRQGKKVFAVGTTTSRVLEHCAETIETGSRDQASRMSGHTDLFIYPGYKFRIVDHMITNFHLPKSTLMLLISAFCGKEFIFDAYREAIEKRYRFFSYGDAMLIL